MSTSTESASREMANFAERERDPQYRLPILNGRNYLYWAEAWEIYLEDKELWEVVMLNPPERVLTPAEQKKNRRAYLLILTNVEPQIQSCIMKGNKSAADAWNTLKERFQGASAMHVHLLNTQLDGLKYEFEKGVSALFSEGRIIFHELQAMGETVKESKIVLSLMKSLPMEFDMVKTMIKANPDITMQGAEHHLLLVEAEVKEKRKSEGETALTAATAVKKAGVKKPAVKCWHCKQRGHKKPNCPNKDKVYDDDGNEIARASLARTTGTKLPYVETIPF